MTASTMAADDIILTRLNELQAERDQLQEENIRLRALLHRPSPERMTESSSPAPDGGHPAPYSSHQESAAVTNKSSPSMKIALFRSLFRGREDVYAVRWEARSGRTGYSPSRALGSRFTGGRNTAPDGQPDPSLLPLTDDVVRDHLLGRQTIGLYPFLLDDTCWFVAADFDKRSWQDDACCFVETCRQFGVSAALERSRSGTGGHVWIFFEEAVAASVARKLACFLLTRTMERRHDVGLDSYDRLFPNQDRLPKGGFGNLIALPLQRGPRARGNTVFVDDRLTPYADQWAFLSGLQRLAVDVLDRIVANAQRTGSVIGVRLSSSDPDADKPWELPPPSNLFEGPIEGQLPERIRIVRGNLVYVEKKGLPSSMLDRLNRLAAFQNPEFYKAQAMRLSTFGKPRVIACAEEFPEHIGLPRGCLDELTALFRALGVKPEIEDARVSGTPIQFSFHGELNVEQERSALAMLLHDDGIMCAPTAFGKTAVAAWLIAHRAVNTLVLVHRRHLLDQWRERLASFLGLPIDEIGQIGGGKNRQTSRVDVAVIQSLGRKGEVKDLVSEYGHVVVDECHHVSAFTFERVLRKVRGRYILGLTATPARKDGHQPIILMQCGPVRFSLAPRTFANSQPFEHKVIPRYTDFSIPLEWQEPRIQDVYKLLTTNERRNDLIADDVIKAVSEDFSPLLLTERTEHLEWFVDRLSKQLPNVIVLRGGMGKRQREAVHDRLESIPPEEPRVIIATGSYIGEGFDDSRLDALFLATPISWRGTLQQYVGRLHRLHHKKRVVKVYDYIDWLTPVLMRMYERRVKGYKALGYVIAEQPGSGLIDTRQSSVEIERMALEAVIKHERARGCQVMNVEDQVRGYDLVSRLFDPLNPKTPIEVRYIEVKGRSGIGEVALTANEYNASQSLGGDYWLYVVFNCASEPEVHVIQDPARLNWQPLTKIEHYYLSAAVVLGEVSNEVRTDGVSLLPIPGS